MAAEVASLSSGMSFCEKKDNKAIDAEFDISALQAIQGWSARVSVEAGVGKRRRNSMTFIVTETSPWRQALDLYSGVLILLNIIYMAVEAEISMNRVRRGEQVPRWLWWGGLAFAVLFAAELGLRLAIERSMFFFGRFWRWNVFDLMLVLFQVADVAFSFVNLSFFRTLRGVRAIRAARIIRTMRYVRELRLMVASINCSLVSLGWALVLLVLVLFLFSLGIVQTVEGQLEQGLVAGSHPGLLELYGSIPDSMLALFMAISGGADWQELVEPLAHVSKAYLICYVLFVTFVLLGMLNILTAIFVESTCKIAEVDADLVIQENLESEDSAINRIRELLAEADATGSGSVSREEFEEKLLDPRFKAQLRLLDLNIFEARGLFQLLDVEQVGEVTLEVLVYSLMRLKGAARAVDMATMLYEHKRLFTKLSTFMKLAEDNFGELRAALIPGAEPWPPRPRPRASSTASSSSC